MLSKPVFFHVENSEFSLQFLYFSQCYISPFWSLVVLLCLNLTLTSSLSPFEEIFGETLYMWNTTTAEVYEYPTNALLNGKKVVGVYLSASWCGPCQRFTPELAAFYKDMNKKGKKFEIVWISQDRSQEDFQQYYTKMPWLAVPVPGIQDALQKFANPKYGLKGIPHLVILDGDDASIITVDGRGMVARDKYGLEFPWRPRTLLSVIPKPLQKLIKRQVTILASTLQKFLYGAMSSVTPSRIVSYFREYVFPAVSHVVTLLYKQAVLRLGNKVTQ
eukprot:gene8240-16944_t